MSVWTMWRTKSIPEIFSAEIKETLHKAVRRALCSVSLTTNGEKSPQKTHVRLRVNTPENKIKKQNGLDSPEFEPFRFFSKKFEKRLDKSIRKWYNKSNLKFEEGMREKEYLFKSRMTWWNPSAIRGLLCLLLNKYSFFYSFLHLDNCISRLKHPKIWCSR